MTERTDTMTEVGPDPGLALPPGRGRSTAARARAVPAPGTRAGAGAGAGAVGVPGVTSNGRPSDPDELRREIERTRARMSSTLDAIEDRVVQGKRELVAKATFQRLRRRLASEPWRSMAIAFVAGYVVAAIRD